MLAGGTQRLLLGLAGQAAGLALALGTPGAIGFGLVIIHLRRPVPRHGDYLKQAAQPVAMQAGGTIRDPEGRRFTVTKRTPIPARFRPVAPLAITTGDNKFIKFTVANQGTTDLKRL